MKKRLWFSEAEYRKFVQDGEAKVVSYEKNQIIALQGEECEALKIILEGSVALQNLDEEGRLFTAQVLTKGKSCGTTLLFGKQTTYPMQVVAQSKCTLLHLKRSLVLRLCEENQEVLIGLLGVISDRAHMLGTTVNRIATLSLRESLLLYLQRLSQEQGSLQIRLPITKKELAERLGFARTSISRDLAALQTEGILSVAGREITLHRSLPLE